MRIFYYGREIFPVIFVIDNVNRYLIFLLRSGVAVGGKISIGFVLFLTGIRDFYLFNARRAVRILCGNVILRVLACGYGSLLRIGFGTFGTAAV